MDYFGLETLDQLPDVESLLELNQEESLSEKEDSSQTYKVKISDLEGGPLR